MASVNSYGYSTLPNVMFGPYQGSVSQSLYTQAGRELAPVRQLSTDRRAAAGRARDGEGAVERLDAVAQPGQATSGRVCAAAAVVRHLDHQALVPVADVTSARASGPACLAALVSVSATTK